MKDVIANRSLSFSLFLDQIRSSSSTLMKEKKELYPTYVLDDKLIGSEFAKLCGLKTPNIIQIGVPLEEVDFLPNTVIKPVYGSSSKGVFVSYSRKNIVYLNTGVSYISAARAKSYARHLIRDKKRVPRDVWMTEELLTNSGSIARDVKFYCFYGKVGLILETERIDCIKRCWFNVDLDYCDTGKYQNSLFKGSRKFLDELKHVAEEVSLEIPSAFVRVDFLISDDVFYLGEFTPIPASYEAFNNEWDSYLGGLYAEATFRITHDISQGKQFENFHRLEKNKKKLITKLLKRSN